jgi:hypothetical protein
MRPRVLRIRIDVLLIQKMHTSSGAVSSFTSSSDTEILFTSHVHRVSDIFYVLIPYRVSSATILSREDNSSLAPIVTA